MYVDVYCLLSTLDVYTTTYISVLRIMAVVVINNVLARLKCFEALLVHAQLIIHLPEIVEEVTASYIVDRCDYAITAKLDLYNLNSPM